MKLPILAVLLSLPLISFAADEPTAKAPLPTEERAFVSAIEGIKKDEITARLGEPNAKSELKDEKGAVIASVYHYHKLNKGEDGSFYDTTELDFMGDKLETVVFLNNDGSDIGKKPITSEQSLKFKPSL